MLYYAFSARHHFRPATTISVAGNSFSDSYNREIMDSPSGSNPTLSSLTTMHTVFTPDMDGNYDIQLTTCNSRGSSSPVTFTITVDDTATLDGANPRPIPTDISFNTHIKPVLQTITLGGTQTCMSCHQDGGAFDEIPLHYTDNNDGGPGTPARQIEGRDLYLEVVQRINFSDPLESWLLRRPSGNQHPGGCRHGFDISRS